LRKQPAYLAFIIIAVVLTGVSMWVTDIIPEEGLLFMFFAIVLMTVAVVFTCFASSEKGLLVLVELVLFWLSAQNAVLLVLDLVGVSQRMTMLITASKEIVVAGILAYLLLRYQRRILRFALVDKLLLIYLIWVTLYLFIPFGQTTLFTKLMGFRMITAFVMLYLVGRLIPISSKTVSVLMQAVLMISVLVSSIGLVERFVVPSDRLSKLISSYYLTKGYEHYAQREVTSLFGEYGTGSSSTRRMVSMYLDPQVMGYALLFPVLLLASTLSSRRIKPSTGISFLIVTSALLLTIARGAIGAAAVGILTMGLYRSRIRRYLWPCGIAGLALSLLLVTKIRQVILSTLTLIDWSAIAHFEALQTGFSILGTNPMGVGLGQSGYVGVNWVGRMSLAGARESFLLSLATQTGVISLLLYIIVVVGILLACHRAAKRQFKDNPIMKDLCITIIATTVGLHFGALFSETSHSFVASGGYWVFVGIVFNALRPYRGSKQEKTVCELGKTIPVASNTTAAVDG
jgi:hypothetical protein